jgi:hypothetical protein
VTIHPGKNKGDAVNLENLRRILSDEGLRTASASLIPSVKEALKKGQFIGEPKIGSYTVVPEGIAVKVAVSVILPPSKALAAAPPKQTLKMVFTKPELLADVPEAVLKTIPFKAMKPAQFTTFVKKMGGLGQYSEDVLRALLEGRSSKPASIGGQPADDYLVDMLEDGIDFDVYVGGAQGGRDYWGGPEATLKIKGGVITGWIRLAIEWENERGLTIKKDVPDYPYIDLDPEIHGEGKESTHPSLRGAYWADPLEGSGVKGWTKRSGRVEVLPKGTPGVWRVSVSREWDIGKIPLASLSRKQLESLVAWMANPTN